jgi:glutamate synthase domain-containing protein 3
VREAAVLIDASELYYRDLNRRIREAVAAGETSFELTNVNGQRYIGDGIKGDDIRIAIHGVPGNDLGAFMDGPTVRVHGNAQDAVANTMNAGRIVVEGDAGDVLGYGMRGGELFVRGDVGYRVGIHMKAYRGQRPVIVAGGTAGDFLGEYMAGGMLIVLGLDGNTRNRLIGDWCGTGMHGGVIYLRGEADPWRVASNFAALQPADDKDLRDMRPHVEAFCGALSLDAEQVLDSEFVRVAPISHRPYGAKYAA